VLWRHAKRRAPYYAPRGVGPSLAVCCNVCGGVGFTNIMNRVLEIAALTELQGPPGTFWLFSSARLETGLMFAPEPWQKTQQPLHIAGLSYNSVAPTVARRQNGSQCRRAASSSLRRDSTHVGASPMRVRPYHSKGAVEWGEFTPTYANARSIRLPVRARFPKFPNELSDTPR